MKRDKRQAKELFGKWPLRLFAFKSLSLACAAGIEKKGTSRDHTTHWLLESFRSLYTYLGKSYCFFRAFKSTQRVLEALCLACLLGIAYEYEYVNMWIYFPFYQTSTIFSISRCWGERHHWCPLFSHRGSGNGVGPWLMVIVVSPLLGGSGKGVYPRLVSSTIGWWNPQQG